MKNESCCFTGHRMIPASEKPLLYKRVSETAEELIAQGITKFFSGGAIGFDMLAADCILELKEKHPHISLHIIVPCENQDVKWSSENKERYRKILSRADEVKCLSPFYYNGCMQVRNRYMADNSVVCVAYLTKASGGTAGTVRYAEKNGLRIINLGA